MYWLLTCDAGNTILSDESHGTSGIILKKKDGSTQYSPIFVTVKKEVTNAFFSLPLGLFGIEDSWIEQKGADGSFISMLSEG